MLSTLLSFVIRTLTLSRQAPNQGLIQWGVALVHLHPPLIPAVPKV